MAESLKNRDCTSPEMVGTAVVLLLLTCCYWQEMKTQLEAADLHREGGRERLSLDIIAHDADQMEAATLSDYVQWVTETYVLKQATRIAIDKLPDYRFFILRDDDGYRLVKSQNPGSYLAYDPNRIQSAFELMADLELLNLTNGYKLTATGRKELDKLRMHHRGRQNRTTAAGGSSEASRKR